MDVVRSSVRRARGALLISFSAAVAVSQAQDPVPNATSQAEVRAVVDRYVQAREHRDARAIAALFTSDADQLVSSGEWRKGRDAVVKGALASSETTGGKRTIAVESVRFPALGVALVDGRYELTGLAGGATRKMRTMLVIVLEPEGWRIAAIRNMLPAAPAPPLQR